MKLDLGEPMVFCSPYVRLLEILTVNLRYGFRARLWGSLYDSFRDSLRESLMESLEEYL